MNKLKVLVVFSLNILRAIVTKTTRMITLLKTCLLLVDHGRYVFKTAFDPADVLVSNRLFKIREEASKNLLQKAMEHNKQVNYIVTVAHDKWKSL